MIRWTRGRRKGSFPRGERGIGGVARNQPSFHTFLDSNLAVPVKPGERVEGNPLAEILLAIDTRSPRSKARRGTARHLL